MSVPTAVVVGVGTERGLGAALCRRFAVEGYHVLVAGRTPEKIEHVAQTIRGAGGSAEPIATDTICVKTTSFVFSIERYRRAADAIRRASSASLPATVS